MKIHRLALVWCFGAFVTGTASCAKTPAEDASGVSTSSLSGTSNAGATNYEESAGPVVDVGSNDGADTTAQAESEVATSAEDDSAIEDQSVENHGIEGGQLADENPGPGEFGMIGTLRGETNDLPPPRGSLDKAEILRVVRAHVREVKYCYEKALQSNPNLEGRVVVKFTIALSGNVAAAVIQQSTMNDKAVEQCIAASVLRWVFPKPRRGIVVVAFPFVFKAGNGSP